MAFSTIMQESKVEFLHKYVFLLYFVHIYSQYVIIEERQLMNGLLPKSPGCSLPPAFSYGHHCKCTDLSELLSTMPPLCRRLPKPYLL